MPDITGLSHLRVPLTFALDTRSRTRHASDQARLTVLRTLVRFTAHAFWRIKIPVDRAGTRSTGLTANPPPSERAQRSLAVPSIPATRCLRRSGARARCLQQQ